jgi:hypothetical protein
MPLGLLAPLAGLIGLGGGNPKRGAERLVSGAKGLFGTEDVLPEQREAIQELLRFGKEGLTPEQRQALLERVFASIQGGVQTGQRGIRERAAAGGLSTTSGLVSGQLAGVQRAGLQARGQAARGVELDILGRQQQALQSLVGARAPEQTAAPAEFLLSLAPLIAGLI